MDVQKELHLLKSKFDTTGSSMFKIAIRGQQ